MINKNIIPFLILLFGACGVSAQQDQMYTQFGFNKLSLNPAYAGNEMYHSITGMYRDQWNGFPGAPDAQLLSANLARFKDRVGLGFTFERQSIGISRRLTFTSNYSYKIKMESGTFSGGLSVALRNLVMDFTDSRLVALQDLGGDNALEISRLSKNLLNVGAGLYFNNEDYFVGVSVPGLIKNDLELGTDNDDVAGTEVRHLYAMAGAIFPINERLDFKPQGLMRWSENAPPSFDLNLGLLYDDRYHMAMTYRSGGAAGNIGESLDMMVGFSVSDEVMIGFAYDFTISDIRRVDNGSVELLFNYRMMPPDPPVNIANPRFF